MLDLSKYLVGLNLERIKNHRVKLIMMVDTSTAIMEEVLEYKHIQSVNKSKFNSKSK